MPPRLARFEVEVSGPNRSPWGASAALKASCTSPGCTRAHISSRLISSTLAEVHRQVEHHRFADRLPGERGAAAARQHRGGRLPGDPDRFRHVRGVAGDHHPEGLDLVDAGVVRVEDPARAVEPHVPLDPRREFARQLSHGPGRVPEQGASETPVFRPASRPPGRETPTVPPARSASLQTGIAAAGRETPMVALPNRVTAYGMAIRHPEKRPCACPTTHPACHENGGNGLDRRLQPARAAR